MTINNAQWSLLLVTGDGCDSADAEYGSESLCVQGLRDTVLELQHDHDTPVHYSDPIDGHGIIYTIRSQASGNPFAPVEPELWVLYRYEIREDTDYEDTDY